MCGILGAATERGKRKGFGHLYKGRHHKRVERSTAAVGARVSTDSCRFGDLLVFPDATLELVILLLLLLLVVRLDFVAQFGWIMDSDLGAFLYLVQSCGL